MIWAGEQQKSLSALYIDHLSQKQILTLCLCLLVFLQPECLELDVYQVSPCVVKTVARKLEDLGTRTSVSLNCHFGAGWLCCNR